MSELRQDPFSGRWVVIAEGRLARPDEYRGRAPAPPDGECPFCGGHEARTPAETAAFGPPGRPPNAPGWTVRSIPNRFPTLEGPPDPHLLGERTPLGVRRAATGYHEVIVMSPDHAPGFAEFLPEAAAEVLRMGRDRIRDLAGRPGIQSSILFENAGPESGGTLTHPHAQAIALPFVPLELAEEAAGARAWARAEGVPCAYEEIGAREEAGGARLLDRGASFVTYAPYASALPYEVRFLPRRHARTFGDSTDAELDELAERVPRTLRALRSLVPGVSYNLVTRSGAGGLGSESEHWYLELLPRTIRPDGFEVGTGVAVNPIPPEAAAERLRAALAAPEAVGEKR